MLPNMTSPIKVLLLDHSYINSMSGQVDCYGDMGTHAE